MKCPFCGQNNTQVKDSRDTVEENAIRRRRECPDCGGRFTTYERIQLQDLTVIKKNGERVLFDQEKLARSIMLAVSKCGISGFEVERMVEDIRREVENDGITEISTKTIGEKVMDRLLSINKVAYIRFASVYKDFKEIKDFEEFVSKISS
ncbi:MAG: transcriptional repressor NrdR [Alphaproteobacteria bacterium]|nr:transcriptional repressor NrdR [Alphaproteobacteria bacterium]MBP3687558.1 transcriptional repressor NrdR [Alphaproteobacteria bacterium]